MIIISIFNQSVNEASWRAITLTDISLQVGLEFTEYSYSSNQCVDETFTQINNGVKETGGAF